MKLVRLVAIFLVTLLVIYPLSIGPMCVLDFKLREKLHIVDSDYIGPSTTFRICYYPILWLMNRRPGTRHALDRYVQFWVSLSGRG